VAAIALVDVDAVDLDTGELLHRGDHRAEGVAVIGIAVQELSRKQRDLSLAAR
jgi:hypothetical protein